MNTTLEISDNMQKSRRKTIGINGILRFCNLVVACLILSGFSREELTDHPYLDWLTLILGLALCLQTHIVLRLEQRNPDPFVLVMAYLLTFFYALRVYTLLLYPVQEVFLKYPYGQADTNYALLYVLIANTFIYAGFYRVKLRGTAEIDTSGYQPTKPRLGVALFALSLLFGPLVEIHLPESIAPFINLIYNNFLTPYIILLVLATYVITFHKCLPAIYIKVVLGGAVVLLVLQTLGFSRSGLLTFANNLLILLLALSPTIQLPRKYVLFGVALMPFVLVAAFASYAISTTSRIVREDNVYTLDEQLELAQASIEQLEDDPRVDFFIGKAFSRAGFFDFSAELIANSDRYSGIFTLGNYMKSIVDNVLTPGFDVFDMPKLSNSLKYAEGNLGKPSKRQESEGSYGSDHFGLYGEMYNLFGYASLIILYFISYLLKKAFKYKGSFNPQVIAINRFMVLFMFLQLMNSYGLDWILMNVLVASVSFYGISKLFPLRLNSKRTPSIGIARMVES